MTPEQAETLPVQCEGALVLRRVYGSWRGRLAASTARVTFGEDGRTARFEHEFRVSEADLVTGAVRALPYEVRPLHDLVARALPRRRADNKRPRVEVSRASSGGYEAPAYACVYIEYAAPFSSRLRVVETSTGRIVVRLGENWPCAFSSCGRFFAYIPPREDTVRVIELATRARRDVRLALEGSLVDAVQLGAGAEVLVAECVASDETRSVACFELATGARRWGVETDRGLRALRPSPVEGAPPVVWCRGHGWLESRSVVDGSVQQRFVGSDGRARYSDDGRYAVLTTREDRFARIDLRTGERSDPADDADGGALALAFDATGASFVTLYSSGRVRVYDLASGAVMHTLDLEGRVDVPAGVSFDASGREVVCAYPDPDSSGRRFVTVRLELASGAPVARFGPLEGELVRLLTAPDGETQWLLADGPQGRFDAALVPRAMNDASLRFSWPGFRTKALAAAGFTVHEDGRVLALLACPVDPESRLEALDVYDAATGELLERRALGPSWRGDDLQRPACFAPGGRSLFCGAERTPPAPEALVELSTAGDGAERVVCEDAEWWLVADEVVLGAGVAVTVPRRRGEAGAVQLGSLANGAELGRCALTNTHDVLDCAALSPDGATLLLGTACGVVLELAVVLPEGAR